MKYTITHIAEWVLLAILALVCIYTAYKTYILKHDVEYITTDTITVCDTITNLQYDTVYFSHYDTINTTDVVIINDTVNDTTYIQLPIYTYVYDTSIIDTLYQTDLRLVLSGYNVTADSCTINTKIMPQTVKKQPFWHNLGVGVGVMYGTGGAGVGVGIMYKL